MAGLSNIFGTSDDGENASTASGDPAGNDAKVEHGPDNPDPRFGADDGAGDTTNAGDVGSADSFDDGGM